MKSKTFYNILIGQAFALNKFVIAIFYFNQAYDTTWRGGILETLHFQNITGQMSKFIANLLAHRFFKVRVETECLNKMEQEEGVPHSSVLSVTCFAQTINIVLGCACKGVKISLYLDDFVMFTTSNNLPSTEW